MCQHHEGPINLVLYTVTYGHHLVLSVSGYKYYLVVLDDCSHCHLIIYRRFL